MASSGTLEPSEKPGPPEKPENPEKSGKQETCSICLENIPNKGESDKLEPYTLNCKHRFHKCCLKSWISKQKTCPLCREIIKPSKRYIDEGLMTIETYNDLIKASVRAMITAGLLTTIEAGEYAHGPAGCALGDLFLNENELEDEIKQYLHDNNDNDSDLSGQIRKVVEIKLRKMCGIIERNRKMGMLNELIQSLEICIISGQNILYSDGIPRDIKLRVEHDMREAICILEARKKERQMLMSSLSN